MDDKTEASSGLSGDQGRPGTDGATGSHKLSTDQGAGDGVPADDAVSHEAEGSETNPGRQQEQAGMRS